MILIWYVRYDILYHMYMWYILTQDPNTNKIKQITGARDSTGVITNFLEVDSQPVLGDWKIKVTAHVSTMYIWYIYKIDKM